MSLSSPFPLKTLIPIQTLAPKPSIPAVAGAPAAAAGSGRRSADLRARRRRLYGGAAEAHDEAPGLRGGAFERAAELFNGGDYYRCHDLVEEMWHEAEEPVRTVLHGILQCAVGFHHLFNQNHRGAMMELGEGLCKLRKMNFEDGPFKEFEKEVAVVLEFLYQTQKELAACTEELCLPMDGSEASYQLLGSFAAGQQVYNVNVDENGIAYLIFHHYSPSKPMVKVPKLDAKEEDLKRCQYTSR